ncbi:antitoxin VbhA family protein [Hymenobacter sp. M29]|uniref:Antitoxin VbhA family protein n=1 Tax=Hymenobacter mellowenesis TaxID=3063995 RepID=A0ABT9AIM1_9BACT|nr:antitoxin VbhA family protein [Hymenobacter sp. M29]MDO7848542.1 antitoxin VbhA family protein [Hymenobacter sp. M29]
MDTLVKFGPKEATREQRQTLSDRAAALNATQDRQLSPFAEQLSQRYINGELSLAEVNTQLDAYYQAQSQTPVPTRGADGILAVAPRPAPAVTKTRSLSH